MTAEVHTATTAGAEITQITKLKAGAQPPLVFSPDGTRVAYVSDVFPECPTRLQRAAR